MTAIDLGQEHNIARCRVVLSLAAILVVYIDVETPLLARWIPFVAGQFTMDPRLFVVMAAHLAYSLVIYGGLRNERMLSARLAAHAVWVDVIFGLAIAIMTEGVTGPAYPFFAFAVVTSGLRGGLRQATLVTAVTLGLYLCLIAIAARHSADIYIMRPLYLGITGYLVSYLGQQRLDLLEQMRQLEVAEQRHRIARDLHDGYAQALAGITLRLEGSRRLLRASAVDEAVTELTDLQDSVNREYDDLRRYARTLAGVEVTQASDGADHGARVRISAELSGSIDLVEQVLSITREGIRNVRRHAGARSAEVDIRGDDARIRITIDDDGVGFARDVTPWSIASRVDEIGGHIEIGADGRPGGHVSITLPKA